MKKVILCIAIIFTFALYISCGADMHSEDNYYYGHGFGMGYGAGCYEDQDAMMSDLDLINDQVNKIAGIDSTYRKYYYENRGNFEKIDQLRKEHQKEIDTILNDEQKTKYATTYNSRWGGWGQGSRRRQMGEYYGNGYGMGYGSGCYENQDYMMQDLDLTNDQANKIAEIDAKYRDLYYKNRDNFNRIDELRGEHRKDIDDVLTPEQRDKFSGVYNNRWRGAGGHMGSGRGMMGY
ncbi:MAG: hypothetical protein MUP22_06345 [Desulfobacterales bacterium]|nr:hypothetical protein [Desulfobacterales bacterium]